MSDISFPSFPSAFKNTSLQGCKHHMAKAFWCIMVKLFRSCTVLQLTGQPAPVHPRLVCVTDLTFIISLDNSLMVAWISGIFTKLCIAFMTSVLFCNEPATLRTAVKERHRITSVIPVSPKGRKLYPPCADKNLHLSNLKETYSLQYKLQTEFYILSLLGQHIRTFIVQ